MVSRKPWTTKEIEYILNNYGVTPLNDIRIQLDRNLWSILNKIKRSKIPKVVEFKTIGRLATETGYDRKQINRAIWALGFTLLTNPSSYRKNPRYLIDEKQSEAIIAYLHKHQMGKPHIKVTHG